MRLFVGIPMDAAVVAELVALQQRLRGRDDGLRWTAPETWHVTLQFLGNSTTEQLECLKTRLGAIEARQVSIQLEQPGVFERVGVFHVGVHPGPGLLQLQQAVTAATMQCGFVPEDRTFRPHITLARAKGRSHALTDLRSRMSSARQFHAFTAKRFLLYESFLGPGGSRYEVRDEFKLS